MIFKLGVLCMIFFTNIFAGVHISFNGNSSQEISVNEAEKLLSKLQNRDVPYKVLKDEYDNFLIEVSASSYAQGVMFGSVFREVAGHSYDAGYGFGSWLRRWFN